MKVEVWGAVPPSELLHLGLLALSRRNPDIRGVGHIHSCVSANA